MSREAWGDPPERQEPPQCCPVCHNEWHAEDCELGQEVSRRLAAEAERDRMRKALTEAADRFRALRGCFEQGTNLRDFVEGFADEAAMAAKEPR